MKIEEDGEHYQFTLDVLKALHLDARPFFADLANNKPYEIQIYKWIEKLYSQGKSADEAIQRIHRVRKLILKQP